MVLGDGSRLPLTRDLAHAHAGQQPHGIGHHLRPLVERLFPAAQRLRRGDVHAADRARDGRPENQRVVRNSGAGVRNLFAVGQVADQRIGRYAAEP